MLVALVALSLTLRAQYSSMMVEDQTYGGGDFALVRNMSGSTFSPTSVSGMNPTQGGMLHIKCFSF